MSRSHYLWPLFEPRSVVVVGASQSVEKVGGRVLANVVAGGFTGELRAVNPRHERVQDVPCFPSVARLPAPVDLAVIATPAATVPGVIDECGRAGIRAAVVISAGFAEAGSAGKQLERELLESAHRHGLRLLGPNCVGLMRTPVALNATFARGNALPGGLALVSQSGAVCTAMLDWATPNRIGFSSVVSMGAASDVDFGEVIDYLAADEKTEHILLYIEGVRDGRRLVSSLRAAARSKPVILMKVGRHPSGSRAAVSHTGAIVGRDDIFEAVVRRTGVVRVSTMRELVMTAQALAAHVRPTGNRLAIVTNGGGPGVMAADRAGDLGLALADLAPATLERLSRTLPPNWSHGNPIDLIGDASPERYGAAVSACLEDSGVDGVIAILTPQAMTRAEDAAGAVAQAARGSSKPVLACWMGEASVLAARRQLREAGLPVFRGPELAVETFADLAAYHRNQQALLEAPGPLAAGEPPDLESARALVRAALAEGRKLLGAGESKSLLEAFRIPVARAVAAASDEEAVRAAGAMGYPVVMKIDSPDITHKSDVEGVRLALADADAVRQAWREMMDEVARRRPEARVTGVSIEPMVASAYARELMAGIVRDPIFGPAITFGAGGVAIEILRDRAVALPPLNSVLVRDMIRDTRVGRMLGEFRNLPAIDHASLEAVLLRVSEIACELPQIEELDVNPLFADPRGTIALDARVVLRDVPAGLPYAHLAILPYPAGLAREVRLASGEAVVIRPIRPEDASQETKFVAGLSERSLRMRFMGALRSLTPSMLARFTQIDYDREMAFVAVHGAPGSEEQVGVCRYATLPDGRTCEYAIVVADAWQGRGLARLMMTRLIEVARGRGLAVMIGYVDSQNSAMLDLCSRLGFAITPEPDDPSARRVTLDLSAPAGAPAPL